VPCRVCWVVGRIPLTPRLNGQREQKISCIASRGSYHILPLLQTAVAKSPLLCSSSSPSLAQEPIGFQSTHLPPAKSPMTAAWAPNTRFSDKSKVPDLSARLTKNVRSYSLKSTNIGCPVRYCSSDARFCTAIVPSNHASGEPTQSYFLAAERRS
jgi:hypothetical protein